VNLPEKTRDKTLFASEIDALWAKLSADLGGGQCGWAEDRFGLSWQIATPELSQMLCDPDPVKSQSVRKSLFISRRTIRFEPVWHERQNNSEKYRACSALNRP
jgi:hypothetical protein